MRVDSAHNNSFSLFDDPAKGAVPSWPVCFQVDGQARFISAIPFKKDRIDFNNDMDYSKIPTKYHHFLTHLDIGRAFTFTLHYRSGHSP
jgi:hypothetical protein